MSDRVFLSGVVRRLAETPAALMGAQAAYRAIFEARPSTFCTQR